MEFIIIALLLVNLAVVGFIFLRKPAPQQDSQSMILLQNRIDALSQSMDAKLGEGTRTMFDSMRAQFGESQRLATDIRDLVHKQLTEVARGVAETNASTKQVFTIAEQLQNLEKVLKNQKQRGNLGEAGLELILNNILPPDRFKMQYDFANGETVDAAIFVKEGIVPVDAKFPLENYVRLLDEKDDEKRGEYEDAFKKDLKKRIDETSKYIRPEEGTLGFAFMYIPAESIYYDLVTGSVGAINARNLLDYAQNEKKVIIVSPTTFFAYLNSVLYGFKAFKIEKDAEQIKKNVENLMKHIAAYDVFYKKVGTSLSTTVNHYNAGYKELAKVDKDILKITGSSSGLEPEGVEKPLLAE
ncbi:DNA recombination protein RmuC [bacterium]|nr:DNA recombination protein RmuC [bacterium]